MFPEPFDYVRCQTLDDVLGALREHGDAAKLLAGGHSLLPLMRLRLAAPEVIVDLTGVDELAYVHDQGDHVAIGAGTRHQDVADSPLLRSDAPIVAHAASVVGDPQVRHRGTIGGSLAHADPAADLPAVMLALDATLVAARADGSTRDVPAGDFFTGLWETALGDDEVLTEVRVPKTGSAGWDYQKFRERSQDWATVGAAVVLDGEPRVSLVNMGTTPVRARAVEDALASGASPAEAAAHAPEGTHPPSDLNGDADYRRHLATVLVRRAIERASA